MVRRRLLLGFMGLGIGALASPHVPRPLSAPTLVVIEQPAPPPPIPEQVCPKLDEPSDVASTRAELATTRARLREVAGEPLAFPPDARWTEERVVAELQKMDLEGFEVDCSEYPCGIVTTVRRDGDRLVGCDLDLRSVFGPSVGTCGPAGSITFAIDPDFPAVPLRLQHRLRRMSWDPPRPGP